MRTVSELIAAKGGLTKVADALGVTVQAVWNMRSRGTIPSKYWTAFIAAPTKPKQKQVRLEELMQLATKRAA